MAEDKTLEKFEDAIHKKDILEKFAEWFACIPGLRDPKTQKEFAKKYKVSEVTLCRWKLDEPYATVFWKHYEKVQPLIMKQYTPEVLSRLYKQAVRKGASSKHQSLWFDVVEKRRQAIDVNLTGNVGIDVSQMTDEQLKAYIAKVQGGQ